MRAAVARSSLRRNGSLNEQKPCMHPLSVRLISACAALACAVPSSRPVDENRGERQRGVVTPVPANAAASGEAIIDPRYEGMRMRDGLIRVDRLPFDYSASTRLVPWRMGPDSGQGIEVRVTAVNRGTRPVRVQYGACAVELFAYHRDRSAATYVWRSSRRSPWSGRYLYACPTYGRDAVVQPGATFQPEEFTMSFQVNELLADSLPNGEYEFAARVGLNFGQSREIPAGRLTVALHRGALPKSRLTQGISYEAAPAAVAARGKELVFGVTATVAYSGGVLYRISPACALHILAYRDRTARDMLPPVRESWRSPAQECEAPTEYTLTCGDSHRAEWRAA